MARSVRAGPYSTPGMSMCPFGIGLATVGVFVPVFFHSVTITVCRTALSEEPCLVAVKQ